MNLQLLLAVWLCGFILMFSAYFTRVCEANELETDIKEKFYNWTFIFFYSAFWFSTCWYSLYIRFKS